MEAEQEKRILCVGLVCLDIISVVDRYPAEDSDSRCLSQRWQRGGNASNTCTVLALLGAPTAFMGSLAPGHAAQPLTAAGVDRIRCSCGQVYIGTTKAVFKCESRNMRDTADWVSQKNQP